MHIKQRILLSLGFLPFIVAPSINALKDLERKLAEPIPECTRTETRTHTTFQTWEEDGVIISGLRPVTVIRCVERS